MKPDLIAYDLINKGKNTEALEYLDLAINNKIGDQLKLYQQRGYVYVCLGDTEKALADFEWALAIEPRSNYALMCKSIINLGAERFEQALADFNLIPETNLLGERYWELGKDIFIKTKNYERALYFAERLCNNDKENYNYVYNKGWCLSKLLRHRESILVYQGLIDRTHFQHLIFNNLGFVYIMVGEYEVAGSYLIKGLKLEPAYAYLNSNISIYYFFKKQMDKAMHHIDVSIENGPSNSFAYFLRSKYLLSLDRNDEALKEMEIAEKLGLNTDFPIERSVLEKTIFSSTH